MIQSAYLHSNSLYSKWAHPHQIIPHSCSNYTSPEIEDIQRKLEFSRETTIKLAAQPKKVEKKEYHHSNKRDAHGMHIRYCEMELEDAPTTAFDAPEAAFVTSSIT